MTVEVSRQVRFYQVSIFSRCPSAITSMMQPAILLFVIALFGSDVFGFIPYTLYTNISLYYDPRLPFIRPKYTSENWYNNPPKYEDTYVKYPYADEEYDFIIVGSGPAGSVIANRLSENPNWKILLLEVGKEPTILTDIPALAAYFQFTDYNWGYLMEEQENMALGFVDRRMHWPRGRVLGGSSVINWMIYTRGNQMDFNRWAENGNKGWSYKDLFQYFLKFENFQVKLKDPEYHSQSGRLNAEDVAYRSKSADAFVAAMQEMGYPYVDYNGKTQRGVSYMHATTKRGRRCSAFNAFLKPVRDRSNLKIYTSARVTKILIDENTRHAWGVKFVKDRLNRVAKARKEVIISAGALSSPQLLMLSGVGPKDHLEELGIRVIQNLPVGKKLYDHLGFFGLTITTNESVTIPLESALYDIRTILDYKHGKGVLTTLSGAEALAFVRTPVSNEVHPFYPDIELISFGANPRIDNGEVYRKLARITDEIYNKMWQPLEIRKAFIISPILLRPKSCGYLRLKSKNPYHWPRFYGNYLTDSGNVDLKTFIASIRMVQKLLRMPSFRKYNARVLDTPVPGCERYAYDSDDYWECSLRHLSTTVHHQTTTCKMGPRSDPEAVVSDKLKVYGISGLRVADTSIIPEPMAAHTNVPSFMIGEKAADLIKEEWLKVE